MPREEITIENFSAGIITTVDAQDTPINAASWSVDQDPEVPQGILRGREGEDVYIDDPTNTHQASTFAWIVREDGKRDFIFYSKTTGKLSSVADFFGAKTYATPATLTAGMNTSLEAHNRSVRLGQGNNDVKYYGYIDHGQYGGAIPSGLQYTNAKLDPVSLFSYLYKVCGTDGTYIYGIEWKGTKIYRITIADGTITPSTESFTSTQGLCEYTIDNSGNFLFLYDRNGPFGTIYKFNKSTMLIAEVYYINGFGAVGYHPGIGAVTVDTGYEISDIEISSNTVLWFSAFWNETINSDITKGVGAIDVVAAPTRGYLFNTTFPLTDGTTYTLTAKNPRLSGYGADTTDGAVELATSYLLRPVKRCFVKTAYVHSGELVYLAEFATANTDWGGLACGIYTSGVGTLKYPGMCGVVINESIAVGDKYGSANCRLFQISTNGANKYTSAIQLVHIIPTTKYGYLATGKDTLVNSYFAAWDNTSAGHHQWSIAGTVWAGNIYLTMIESVSQGSKYGNTINTSIAKTETSFNLYTNTYWETALDSVGRALTNTIDIDTLTFNIAQVYVVHGVGVIATLLITGLSDFIATKKYYYKVSVEYDNSQESPLFIPGPTIVTPADTNTIELTITIPLTVLPNLRATAIKVYRAESLLAQKQPTSLYRLAGRLQIADSNWSANTTSPWGTQKVKLFQDQGAYGPTYESETGIPETLPNNFMRYTIATQGNGYFFIGQVYNEQFGTNSIANTIFRSKRNAPDTFDWSNDFLVLPVRPLALHFFRNMLFAFDQNMVYVIDPESFQLISKLDGYGVVEPSNIVSNNEFMVFANANNVYLHDGQNVSIISHAINIAQYATIATLSTQTHRGLMFVSRSLSIAFLSKMNCVALCYSLSEEMPFMFIFHIPTKSWYYWQIVKTGTTLNSAGVGSKIIFSDYFGNVYLSTLGGIVRIATNATRNSCTWISRQFNGGNVTLIKKFIRIILNVPYGAGTLFSYYSLNANTTITTSFISGVNLSDSTTKANSIWIKVLIGATEQLQGITLIFRRMIGLR